jgi:hypothetical protein
MQRCTTERLSEKTAEKQLLRELELDFELAPATSRAVLETVQEVLLPRAGASAAGELGV